jgi:hypothetical protein
MEMEQQLAKLSKNGSFSLRQEGNWNGSNSLKESVNQVRDTENTCTDAPMGGWGNTGTCTTGGVFSGWNN